MMEVDNLHKIVDSVRELNKEAEIISCDWDDFDDLDYNSLINMQFDLEKNRTSNIESTSEISDGIQSISIKSPKKFRKNELENMLKEISKDKYGIVIRSKGFINGDDGSLEFNFVNERFTISKNEFNNSDRVCIIGKNLDENNIFKLLL